MPSVKVSVLTHGTNSAEVTGILKLGLVGIRELFAGCFFGNGVEKWK